MQQSIFVQMASYRDPQLIPTLQDMVRQAVRPECLRIVVSWQHGLDEMIGRFFAQGFSRWQVDAAGARPVHTLAFGEATIELIDVSAMETQGACWARNMIQQRYGGERYTLQVDSHHRFVTGWDRILIDMLESLRADSDKPLLTAYLPEFDPENDPAGRGQNPTALHIDQFASEGALLPLSRSIPDWTLLDKPLPARFYSAHFAFSDGHFATTVQHDPEFFFIGEEISIAVRAFTHGYDLYHPHRLIAWHEYTRRLRVKMWDDHTDENTANGVVAKPWHERDGLSHRRNRILFGMDGESGTSIDFGPYGFGTARSLAQYEAYAGVSFSLRGVKRDTLERQPPVPGAPVPETEAAYRESLLRSHNLNPHFHQGMLGDLSNVARAEFTVFSEKGEVMYQEAMSTAELMAAMEHGWLRNRFVFFSELDMVPAHYTVRFYAADDVTLREETHPIAQPLEP